MKKMVLNKRILRELKKNALRYLALLLLIVIGTTFVLGMATASDSILSTVSDFQKNSVVEDGEFYVFVPLTDKEIVKLEKQGIQIEENFYITTTLADGSMLRVFKNREHINLIALNDGKNAASGEIVLEESYAASHHLQTGDAITIANQEFIISGIGSSPDYNLVVKSLSDAGADPAAFGTAFVTESSYDELKDDKADGGIEESCYSYRIQGDITNDELFEVLNKLKLDTEQINNKYMQEIVDDVEGVKYELLDAVAKLEDGGSDLSDATDEFQKGAVTLNVSVADFVENIDSIISGIDEIYDGLNTLTENNSKLLDGADAVFTALLENASTSLANAGIEVNLTISNYRDVLSGVLGQSKKLSRQQKEEIQGIMDSLESCSTFCTGIGEYTTGVQSAYEGAKGLNSGVRQLKEGNQNLLLGAEALTENNEDLVNGSETLAQMLAGTVDDELKNLADMLRNGIGDYTTSAGQIKDGISTVQSQMTEIEKYTGELESGLDTLTQSNGALTTGADDMFQAILDIVSVQLQTNGIQVTLTKDSYKDQLNSIDTDAVVQKEFTDQIKDLKGQIDSYNEFYLGIDSYVDGVNQISGGVSTLNSYMGDVEDASTQLVDAATTIYDKSEDLQDGAKELKEGIRKLSDSSNELINEIFDFEYQNMYQFIPAVDNSRINDYSYDAEVNKQSAMLAGVIVFVIIAYVISVFLVDDIDKQSAIIGALYSLGYKKSELLSHFMSIPVVISLVGGIIGTVLGFWAAPMLVTTNETYYSYPAIQYTYPAYLILYGCLVSVVITIVVSYIILNKKLSQNPLKLLRKEKKQRASLGINLDRFNFIRKYQIRQYLREIRAHIILFVGIFVSLILLVLAFTMHSSITKLAQNTTRDVQFEYMYLLKFPEKDARFSNAEKVYTVSLKTYFSKLGGDINVNLQGIQSESKYFDFQAIDTQKNEVYISSAAQLKFGWQEGETIVLKDDLNNDYFAFKVKGVVQYSNGVYVFMNIDSMNELFGQEDDYYNTLFSKKKLDIESGRILSVTTIDEINSVAKLFLKLMSAMITMLIVSSVLLFFVIMFLLLKLMVDKATTSISLIKVFGFKESEINKLYINSNFFTVIVATIIGVPLAKYIVNLIHPYLVSNIAVGYPLELSPVIYLLIITMVFVTYIVVSLILRRYTRKVSLNETLRNRE